MPDWGVQIQAAGGVRASGVIDRISPVVEAESGTVKVTVELDGAGTDAGALVPGSFVTVLVPTETRPNAVVVPKRAILLERDQSIVYRVQEGVAVRTPVAVGLSAQDLVEITSGLSVGDVVVTIGNESLRDGAPVRAAGEPLPEGAEYAAADGESSASASAPAAADDGGQGGAAGAGGGGFSLAQIPEQRRQALVERLLANPQVKEAYDAKLKEDPDLETDQEKRLAFFQEQLEAIGGPQALFGGGGGGAGGGAGAARQGAAGGGEGAAGAGGQRGAGGQAGGADQAAAGASAGQAAAGAAGGGGGGFSLAQLPEQRREALIERLLQNEEVKKAYDAKLKEDPSLENDEPRRLEFLQEQLQAIGGPRALFGGGGGGGFGGGGG